MDDLPPPVKITSNVPNIPSAPNISKQPGFFKKAFNFIIKIKWVKVSLYFAGLGTFLAMFISHPISNNIINQILPGSSPVFARDVSKQGVLKSSASGLYILVLPDQEAYTLHFKPSVTLANLKKINEAVVKGRLGWTPFVIEDAEIYPLNFTTAEQWQASLTVSNDYDTFTPQSSALHNEVGPNPSNPPNTPNSSDQLPKLYPNLQWETSQKRVLVFTSGKRRMEVEGYHLESSPLTSFPQDFINYYIGELQSMGFKETLNSINPEGVMSTYSKNDLFLTFGIKNIYKDSRENKQLAGFTAYLEHN